MSSGSSIGSPMMSAVVALHFRAGRADGRRRCSRARSLCSGDLCASCPGSFSGGSSVKVVGVRVVGDAGRLSRPLSRRTRRRRRRCSRARDRRRLHDPLGHPFPTPLVIYLCTRTLYDRRKRNLLYCVTRYSALGLKPLAVPYSPENAFRASAHISRTPDDLSPSSTSRNQIMEPAAPDEEAAPAPVGKRKLSRKQQLKEARAKKKERSNTRPDVSTGRS